MITTEQNVQIPTDRLRDAIKKAYELSVPMGMGFLHAKNGGLDDATTDAIIERSKLDWIAANMDYVHGRCCKFTVYRADGELFVNPRWYDHTRQQLVELLTAVGVDDAETKIDTAISARDKANSEYERGEM